MKLLFILLLLTLSLFANIPQVKPGTVRYEYNALNQRIKTIYPDGSTVEQTMDASGLPVRKRDEAGRVTSYAYDANRTIPLLGQITLPNGATTRYAYDAQGHKIAQTDPLGHTVRWDYAATGELLGQTLPSGAQTQHHYDPSGKLSQITDFAGKSQTFIYDSNDRLVRIEYDDGSGVTYDYTPSGRLRRVSDDRGSIVYSYDSRGRIASVTMPSGETIRYGYDGAGNIVKIETPTQTITKTYDALNRLKTVTDDQGTTTYDYDAAGRVTKITYPSGITTEYGYDLRDRITRIVHKASDGTILRSFAYSYDATGNPVKVLENTGRTVTYEYNSVNQLIKETVSNDPDGNNTVTTFAYDQAGNLVSKTVEGITTEYSYDADGKLIQKGSITYTYDANGNLIDDGTNAYEYDDKNRLVKVTTPTETIEYSYDAQDHRIAKIVEGTTTTYLVDPNTPYAQVIRESKENGTEVYYTYGKDLLSDGSHTFLTDALGSTRGLADRAGQLTDSYDYSPYGTLLRHSGSSDNPFLFTGEQYDKETGNYYLRARYYSPELSRFLTRDTYEGTLTDPLSQNAYLYARGNPAVYVDPSGRCFVAGAIDMIMVVDIMGSLRSSEIRFLTVRGVAMAGRASEIVLNSGHTVRALRAMRRSNRGLFQRLEEYLGEKVEIHHILEKRFLPKQNISPDMKKLLDKLGHADNMPGIVLTKSRHRIITERWQRELRRSYRGENGRYKSITVEEIINAAENVYFDDPIQMHTVVNYLMGLIL